MTPAAGGGQAREVPRRLMVVAGLAEGRSHTAIAAALGIRRGTLTDYVYRLSRSVGAPDRAALITYAYRHGWLAVPATPAGKVADCPRPLPHLARLLEYMARGMDNRQIAAALGLTHHTVCAYGRDLRAHYGARHRAHTVALAHQHGHLPTTTRSST
ncbi:LuxR C-terminal-related transcriptional regulator [Streptomyces sp. NPDC087851]|uniref:LuxR C-terminal-related transcriptional regulator n=1 Tax=Streptomyces sp. NPDC087851 TaxID=3365810 RepID=UPI003817F298